MSRGGGMSPYIIYMEGGGTSQSSQPLQRLG